MGNDPKGTQPSNENQPTAQTAAEFSFINVKVGQVPGKIVDIVLNGGRKIADALQVADLNPRGREVRVNARLVEGDPDLQEGDMVLVVGKIKGN